jgi:hypothetical protein
MDDEGSIVRADRLLDDVRRIATDYAVHQILHNGFAGEISDLTRFYVLYRWNYGEAKVQFDEARKLAQSCSIDLAKEWSRQGFIKKDKQFMSVLGPQDRKIEYFKNSSELIDVLHSVLLLWEKSKRDEMVSLLQESGYGKGEAFYRVAQAVSETLPIESKEKKLLDGFLAGRERLREEIMKNILKTKGQTPRVNINTLFFLYPMESERSGFINTMKRKIAYDYIEKDKNLNLSDDQKKDVRKELKKMEANLKESIRRFYRMVAVPDKEGLKNADLGIPTYGEENRIMRIKSKKRSGNWGLNWMRNRTQSHS